MKLKSLLCAVLAAGFLTACETEKNEKHETEAQLQAEAKISRAEAEKIALTKAPDGTIKEGELEREHGKLIWSFDIARPGTANITEVGVDAITGKIVSTEQETPAQQAKEKNEKK
jgi:uncharacterized membrane protein YkoI